MPETEPTDPAKVEEFIVLLSQHDPMLTNYVMAMMPDAADAQGLWRETKLALWRSMHRFQHGTNFGAWALKTALCRILDFRKQKARENKRIWFTDECNELLAEEYEAKPGEYFGRSEKLKECIGKLQPSHRKIFSRVISGTNRWRR
jgi:DNA-directed RNA polymerase specialized sigma24 family protein